MPALFSSSRGVIAVVSSIFTLLPLATYALTDGSTTIGTAPGSVCRMMQTEVTTLASTAGKQDALPAAPTTPAATQSATDFKALTGRFRIVYTPLKNQTYAKLEQYLRKERLPGVAKAERV